MIESTVNSMDSVKLYSVILRSCCEDQVFLVNYELKVISLPEFIGADEKTKNMEENVRKIAALCMSLKPNIG